MHVDSGAQSTTFSCDIEINTVRVDKWNMSVIESFSLASFATLLAKNKSMFLLNHLFILNWVLRSYTLPLYTYRVEPKDPAAAINQFSLIVALSICWVFFWLS